ncbi:hypothetical protein [Streptacidiphilus rugosus]|uniref:hypothetical protein n=1 Tax=Streptacidiphilus rugosus TaxID=405783 RepID=UPI001E2A7464|nr:hypothetical protein [Streptacidiphilus rugosus]
MTESAPVRVHVPTLDEGARPFRRVEILGQLVGKAYGLADVIEFMRRAGIHEGDVHDPGLIHWQGGGLAVWA